MKTKLAEGMAVLAKVRARPPLKIGDVVVPNLLDTGADIVASGNLSS